MRATREYMPPFGLTETFIDSPKVIAYVLMANAV